MTRYLRGVLALVVGAVIFSVLSLTALLLAIVTVGLARPLLVHVPMWMGKVMVVVVYRGILGMQIIVGQPTNQQRPTRQVLAIANHPTMLLMMLLGAHFEQLAGVPLVFVGKRELLWNPLIGWTFIVTGLGILIDRSKRASALQKIIRSIGRVMRRGCGLGILPDQSRPTQKFIADDQKKFAGQVPYIEDFRFTGVPRDGGVFTCYDAMEHPRVIDVTAECTVPTARWCDVFGMVGSTYVITAEDVTDSVPQNPEERRVWLQSRWRQKNKTIAYWRNKN